MEEKTTTRLDDICYRLMRDQSLEVDMPDEEKVPDCQSTTRTFADGLGSLQDLEDMAISMDHGDHCLSKHLTTIIERPLPLSVAS